MDVPLPRDELASHALELCFVEDFFVDLFFLKSFDVLACEFDDDCLRDAFQRCDDQTDSFLVVEVLLHFVYLIAEFTVFVRVD